ncbi:MAG: cobalamin-dependent protein [Planctomycetes bacterium]|nr:cobalamin-dependent protein [Planctomycetota bacterium]
MPLNLAEDLHEIAAVDDRPVHPLGARAKVLLTSVFGPYAQDDEFGSSSINPMELYHNQVTRTQGPFSLRMFHRSWGIMMIQCNISAPCNLLDFPTRERFIHELKTVRYDVIGISSILVNVLKVREMCRLIRRHQPDAKIVVGGHIANLEDLQERVNADHVVKGEGVEWFRHYLGEKTDQPYRHPAVYSPVNMRSMGVKVPNKPGDTAATLIPSVGCPMGCNFCSTSAMFGGKGKFNTFYETGDELFQVLLGLERDLKARSFFVMDENFLLNRKRALRLLELMEQQGKPWSFYLFASANVLRKYSMDELLRIGVSWIWIGLEGENSQYGKLAGANTLEMIREFQANGIRVLGSTIIGLEEHTPENIDAAINYAVSHATDFHQFMLYTPLPGTPLHKGLREQGLIMEEDRVALTEIHGQARFNYRHPHIQHGLETELLLRAFNRDFEVNGPSVVRIVETTLKGWQRHKQHPDTRVRERIRWESKDLATTWSAVLAATRRYYRNDPAMRARLSALLAALHSEFGLKAKLASAFGGVFVGHMMKREMKRLARGETSEPPTFYESNYKDAESAPDACRSVAPDAEVFANDSQLSLC